MFLGDVIIFCSAVLEAMVHEAARNMLLPCLQERNSVTIFWNISPKHLFMLSNLFQYVSSRLSILLWINSVEALVFSSLLIILILVILHFTIATMRLRNRECTKRMQNKQLNSLDFTVSIWSDSGSVSLLL